MSAITDPIGGAMQRGQLDGEFAKVLNAARDRRSEPGVMTTIVTGHLAQMRLFALRQGVEFYPKRDTYGFRRVFLENLVESNEIDSRLDGVIDDKLVDGGGLWFFRPVGDSYRILWFRKKDYRVYLDVNDEIDVLELIYPYKARKTQQVMGFGAGATPRQRPIGQPEQKWVHVKVTRSQIEETIWDARPSFDSETGTAAPGNKQRTLVNALGFIPAVEVFNHLGANGKETVGEFNGFADHILTHNEMVADIASNVGFYGSPTLLSSRPRRDLVEMRGDNASTSSRATIRAGFRSAGEKGGQIMGGGATRALGQERVQKIIHNLEPNDRVGYITPNAVSGDQLTFAKQFREEVRTALGGVDELGISSGATAYEIRSLFGRAAATAMRKCRNLFDYGLCKLLALIITHEERIFKESFAMAMEMPMPEAPIKEEILSDGVTTEEEYEAMSSQFELDHSAWESLLSARIEEAIKNQEIPTGVVGLIPDGDARVEWRHRGPVFEDNSRDLLNNTIVCRNLQELGIGSVDALRHIFPGKTPEELSAMLNGYPFRVVAETQKSISQIMGLINEMRMTPHPQKLDVPLIADARLDLTPALYRALDSLKRELSHGRSAGPGAGDGHGASELTALERSRAERGLPADDGTGVRARAFRPDSAGQRMGGSSESDQPRLDRDAPIPAPGAVLSSDPAGLPAGAGSDLRSSTGLPAAGQPGLAATGSDLLAGLPSSYRRAADSLAAANASGARRRTS